MHAGLLFVAQHAQLLSLGDHLGVRVDGLLGRRAQIRADFADQHRNVVEQPIAGKDFIDFDGHDLVEPLEPCQGQRAILGVEAFRDEMREPIRLIS